MTNDEKIRLVLETLGVDNVRQASRAIREMAESVDSLEGELAQLEKSIKEGVEAPMERFLVTLKDGRKVWNDSAEGLKHLGKTVGRDGDFGRRMLEASYMIDDIQYGFRGVVNNIPQFARTFNISTAAIGAFGIGAVAVNQALAMLGPYLEDTEKALKPLNERMDEFAKGIGGAAVQAEKLENQIKSLAKTSVPGYTEELYKSVKSIRDLIEAQRDLIKIKEEDANREKQRKQENDAIEQGMNADKTLGGLVDEFLGPTDDKANAARLAGIRDTLAKDEVQRAINEKIENELAAMEARGDFSDTSVWGMALPFVNKGGTAIRGYERRDARVAARRNAAREQLAKQTGEQDPDVQRRAAEIAAGKMGAARGGDEQAIREIQALMPELGDFLAGDEADKAFQQGLSDRSRAIRNRNERRRKIEEKTRQGLIDVGLKMGRPGGIDDEIAIQQGRASKGGGPAGVIEDVAAAVTPKSPEELASLAQEAEIRNQVLAQFDPAQMAAARNAQAGSGPWRNRNLQQLRNRDLEIYRNVLEQQGLSPDAADTAARESLQGGENQFEEFAQRLGKSLENGLRAREATNQFFRMMGMRLDDFEMQMEMLLQQQFMNHQATSVRPMNGRARQ